MPNVIDELVVTLNFDKSKFSEGQKEALEEMRRLREEMNKHGAEIDARGKRTESMFANIKREALSLTALFLGGRGIKQFVSEITSADAATGRLSKTLATNIEEVSAWQSAVKQAGGTAEGAVSALSGLSGEMSSFQLTGQSSMLPVLSRLGISLYDSNRNLKTATDLWLELSSAVEGMDPRTATAFLQMIPGANQDMINFALLGRNAMETYLRAGRQAGVVTKEAAEAAAEYRREIELLDQSASNLGRTILTKLAPAMTGLMDIWQKTLSGADHPKSMLQIAPNSMLDRYRKWLRGESKGTLLEELKQSDTVTGNWGVNRRRTEEAAAADAKQKELGPVNKGVSHPGYTMPAAEVEARIRAAALKRGIDPETAMAVAKSEGFYNYKSTVPGEDSVGPFQLYHGTKGGGGLGTAFRKKTGLDAHDPSTVQQQIDFALDHAKQNGWGAWYGWKGLPYAGIGGRPGASPAAMTAGAGGASSSTKTTSVTIQRMDINAPKATDAPGIAQEIGPALDRAVTAGAMNYGAN